MLIECNFGYAAWLLRPQEFGASVGMTLSETLGYTNYGSADELFGALVRLLAPDRKRN